MSVEATATPSRVALPRFDVVFLDLDETLCSWMAQALAKHRTTLTYVIRDYGWKPGDGRKVYEILGWDKKKFWAPIDEDPNFWHGLPKLPHCDLLVEIAQQLAPIVSVLSSPHQHENCYGGKHEWIKQFLPPEIGTVLTSEKHLLARPGRLLIDDQDNKVDAFRAAGGSAILIPQHWNSAHDKAPYGVLFYLAMELEKLRREQIAGMRRIVALSSPRARLGSFGPRVAKDESLDAEWPIWMHAPPPAGYGPGTNTGHGHAWQRPDGHYAKCLGVKHCPECTRDLKHFYGDDAEIVKAGNPTMDEAIVEINTAIAKSIGEHIKSRLQADAELPITLLGYPVVQSPDHPIEIKPGDIVFGPPLGSQGQDMLRRITRNSDLK